MSPVCTRLANDALLQPARDLGSGLLAALAAAIMMMRRSRTLGRYADSHALLTQGLIVAALVATTACDQRRPSLASAALADSIVLSAVLDTIARADSLGDIPLVREYAPFRNYGNRNAAWFVRQYPGLTIAMIDQLRSARGTDARLPEILRLPSSKWLDSVALVPQRTGRQKEPVTILSALLFSRVAYSSDSTFAAVYVVHECGPLCGNGRLFLLRRVVSQWHIERIALQWIS